MSRVSVLIPTYNGEQSIGRLVEAVINQPTNRSKLHEIIIVNDCSPDNSHPKLLELQATYPDLVTYVRLFRNFGEHNAVMCGLHHVTGDCAVIIDDDFQNPPAEIFRLADKLFADDLDVVYSYYAEKKHHFLRNLGSQFNDKCATLLLKKPPNLYLSSFKAMGADLCRIVTQYRAPFPYIDGIILRSTTNIGKLQCEHNARTQGESSYTLRRLVRLWLNMFTGFSIVPLRFASVIGFVLFILSLLMTVFFVAERLFWGMNLPPGWASLIVISTFFAGVQLCLLGLIGEYIGRILLTQGNTPQFLIRESHLKDEAD